MSDRSITLFAKDADLLPVETGPAGLLFACARDGAACRHYPSAILLKDLIGDFDETHARAGCLAHKLLADEPECRGIRQLAVFEEVICRELQRVFHLVQLHEHLRADGFAHCRYCGAPADAAELAWLAGDRQSELRVTYPHVPAEKPASSALRRSWGRMRAAHFSRRSLFGEWRQVLERVDPFHRRERTGYRGGPRTSGGIWFYSTAHTFTGIGLLFEPYFPQPFRYLVENPLTGGEPLRACGRSWVSPYAFGSKDMEPSAAELQAAREAIVSHLQRVSLTQREAVALRLFLNGGFFQTFLSRHLPAGLYASALFDRWAEQTRPEALVVGNFVFEGYALHAARRHGIPTTMLQHGTLGDDYQHIDPPVDHLVVRGTFWREFLPGPVRARAIALGPPLAEGTAVTAKGVRDALVFITTPYGLIDFRHATDVDDILEALIAVTQEQGRELIIRVHPLEDVEQYRNCVQGIRRNGGGTAKISYSQGAGLDQVLERAAVAVLFCSTVLLDCLRHRVPMISFGWHHFSFRRRTEDQGLFHFAEDIAGLKQLTKKGLSGELPAFTGSLEPFLADTPAAALRERLACRVEPGADRWHRVSA